MINTMGVSGLSDLLNSPKSVIIVKRNIPSSGGITSKILQDLVVCNKLGYSAVLLCEKIDDRLANTLFKDLKYSVVKIFNPFGIFGNNFLQ